MNDFTRDMSAPAAAKRNRFVTTLRRALAAASGLPRLAFAAIALLSSFIIHHSAFADQPLIVTLVSEVTSIQPGRPFYVGLHLHHGTGYHSYWKFPGVAGVPPGMQWKLPAGFEAGEIEWPEPQRVLMFQIKCQGFERDVVLPMRITPPANLKPGQTVRLEGRSFWMSCLQVCTPGFTDLALNLPVKAEPPQFDEKWRPLFEAERARYAQPSAAWTATAVEKNQTVTLTLSPASPSARRLTSAADAAKLIFFTDDGWIHSDKPQVVQLREDGSLVITLIVSDVYLKDQPPTALHGIVHNPAGWLMDGQLTGLQVSPPLQR